MSAKSITSGPDHSISKINEASFRGWKMVIQEGNLCRKHDFLFGVNFFFLNRSLVCICDLYVNVPAHVLRESNFVWDRFS